MDTLPKDILGGLLAGALAKTLGLWAVARNQQKRYVKVGHVSEIYAYPVKSCASVSVREGRATKCGISFQGVTDRTWMINYKDTNGKPNMRTDPKLTLVTTTIQDDKICLQAPNMPPLYLPKQADLRKRRPLSVSTVHGEKPNIDDKDMYVIDCGEEADQWISKYLGRACRLIYSTEEICNRDISYQRREWDSNTVEGDATVFSFLTSYLITSTASLKEVNTQLTEPVTSVNFRPSIVVDNTTAWEEDNWSLLRVGSKALFRRVEPCIRCTITTIDPQTGIRRKDNQPLKLLRSYRCREPYGEAPVYGSYMACDVTGEVKVGDPVYALVNTA